MEAEYCKQFEDCSKCPYDKYAYCPAVNYRIREQGKITRAKTHTRRNSTTEKYIDVYVESSAKPELTANEIVSKLIQSDGRIITNTFYVNQVMNKKYRRKKINGAYHYFAKFRETPKKIKNRRKQPMSTFFPQNKFQNDMYIRQKLPVKFQTEACLDYFSRNEDKQGFVKFYLDVRILYYVLTDKVCNSITWRKSQGIVVIEQQDALMPEFVFIEESWKGILSKYCVYLDQEQKHIYRSSRRTEKTSRFV